MILKPQKFSYPIKKHTLTKRLVVCLLFNDNPPLLGKTFDVSGNRNTGTLVGDTHFVPGKFGPALNFDGSLDCVILSSLLSEIVYNKDYSIVWSMKLNATPDEDDFIFSQYGGTSDRFGITMQSTSLDFGHYDGNSYNAISHNTALASNVWYRVVAVNYSDRTKKLYVNNVDDSGEGKGENPASGGFFYIGQRGDNSKFFDGQLGYVMVFNRALTASEIALLYREPFFMFEREPIELWAAATQGGGAPPAGIPIFRRRIEAA